MLSDVHFSSAKQDWQTPDELLDLVRSYRSIRLDPCTSADNPTNAKDFFTEKDDGIEQNWGMDQGGLIYVNPPYGRELRFWVEKCVSESARRPFLEEHSLNSEIILLMPARTDTTYWHHGVLSHAEAICYVKGRLKFRGAPSSAPFPSALVYFGDRPEAFKKHFSGIGHVQLSS